MASAEAMRRMPTHQARAIQISPPTGCWSNKALIVLTIEVIGWFSAKARTGPGIEAVGTNAELMNGRKMIGYEKAAAPSTDFADNPAITAIQVSASVNRTRMPATASHASTPGRRAEADEECHKDDDYHGDRVGHQRGQNMPPQHGRAGDRHRVEPLEDAALQVVEQAEGGIGDAAGDRDEQDAGQQVVHIVVGACLDGAAEHVDEQQQEGDRHDRHRDDGVHAACDVSQGTPEHHTRVAEEMGVHRILGAETPGFSRGRKRRISCRVLPACGTREHRSEFTRTICGQLAGDGPAEGVAVTPRAFSEAATWIARGCWGEGLTNQTTAHHRAEGATRAVLAWGAQLAVCARMQAVEALTAVNAPPRESGPQFGPRGSGRYAARTSRLKLVERVALNTLERRIVCRLVLGDRQRALLHEPDGHVGGAELVWRAGVYYLHVTQRHPASPSVTQRRPAPAEHDPPVERWA